MLWENLWIFLCKGETCFYYIQYVDRRMQFFKSSIFPTTFLVYTKFQWRCTNLPSIVLMWLSILGAVLSAEDRLALHTGTSIFPSMRLLNYVKLKDAVRILSRKRRCAAVSALHRVYHPQRFCSVTVRIWHLLHIRCYRGGLSDLCELCSHWGDDLLSLAVYSALQCFCSCSVRWTCDT